MSDKTFKRVLVIGSNSFSGASFVSHLLDLGIEVVGVSRSPEPIPAMLPYKWRDHANFRFHQLDLNHDLEAIMALVNKFQPEVVANFAAQSMVAESWEHPEDWFQTNVLANVKLHDRLRRCNFLERYVHVSTPEVYGSCNGSVSEDASYHFLQGLWLPCAVYASSKRLRAGAAALSHYPSDNSVHQAWQKDTTARWRNFKTLVHPHP